ncbi:putative cytochrome P450 120 [Ruditapes philippinarum]|uniref:putative cytochrome P450 120 n=1 Tax=Ruditapes philippinarum TaxID=129788 RepID=UPI00295BA2EC|nr:putative cytochrome P450 120 [Ruditapes philippinarum]
MAKVPGSAGFPLVGDRSYDFYKDPIKFQNKHMENTKSRVFLSRFLNKPTIFIGSNAILQEVLKDHAHEMELGYKQFMGEIYGENIIFSDGNCAESLRETLKHLFTSEAVQSYQSTIDRVVKKAIGTLEDGKTFCVYQFFKKLAVEICLSLFLGLDFSESEAEIISQLTTTHWHGIISVPVAIKVPKMSESTYSKALDAKVPFRTILWIHKGKHHYTQWNTLVTNFSNSRALLSSDESCYVCCLFFLFQNDLQNDMLENEDLIESVVLEVLRLYPPFIGGRRVIAQEFTAGGYKMPAGHAILYLTYLAQRDPTVFDNPDEFKPGRWHGKNKNDRDKLFCFGSGPRSCLGQKLVWTLIKTVIKELMTNFKFTLEPGQDLEHKWLPVSRPKGNILVKLETRQTDGQNLES